MTAASHSSDSPAGEVLGDWLARYKDAHRDELAGDDDFARWLEEDYAPIAGGWHY